MKSLTVILLACLLLVAVPALAQFPAQGDDLTTSLGSFKIQITNTFAPMFAGCTGYNATTQILQSPTLYDPGTIVGRSNVINDGDNNDVNGVAVGTAKTIVSESMLFPPPGFPCSGVTGCTSGAGTREVHTEVRSLKMTSGPVAVRAGVWYDSATQSGPPSRVSPGEVESHSGPGGAAANDFPASSFFDVFVQVDMPACGTGGFPGATLYNSSPLIVKNFNIMAFPPKIVYLHDSSTAVPILFKNANPPKWNADDILGYFVLAGHGIGYTNSQSDINAFNNYMNCQTVGTAPSSPSAPTSTAKTAPTSGDATISSTNISTCTSTTETASPQTTAKPK